MDKDAFLIRKMKNGDEKAMDDFVEKYYGNILNYCFYRCMDRHEAENMTQETFVKFFGALASYRHRGKAINYLYTIARNICIDWGKREFHRRKVETDIGDLSEREEYLGREMMRDDVEAAAAVMDIHSALNELPKDFRRVIELYYYQGMNMRELQICWE